MEQIAIYVMLFAVVVAIGQFFNKSIVPLSLWLVMMGMLLSVWPNFPEVTLDSTVVLNIFLPVLIYQISSFSSWKDFKKNARPISLLSVGHVLFITVLMALVFHALLPSLGWPLAFVLGAVVSPPDDVAIISIAEKIRMPERILTILEGEAMFNDATALILFRFALAAIITHEFSAVQAVSAFILVVIGESLYGLVLGFILGELRLRIRDPMLHMIASILTPFLAYFPAEMLGGSGVLATAVTGFVIGHRYSLRFSPDFRLLSRAVWPTLVFAMQSILFLLIGLNLHSILNKISSIPLPDLFLYSTSTVLIVILGRFLWVYGAVAYLPRALFPAIRKRDPYPPWQYSFIVSWAGMRGGISLAAALAVPALPATSQILHPQELIVFLVFCVIVVTLLVQGLTLPWLLKVIGAQQYGLREKHDEHLAELTAKLRMTQAVLRWLCDYKKIVKSTPLMDEVDLYLQEYRFQKKQLSEKIDRDGKEIVDDDTTEKRRDSSLVAQIVEIERSELLLMWHAEKINLSVRNKLIAQLDHKSKHLP